MERVTGIGGVFVRARQTAELRAWYARHLGIDVAEWGGQEFAWTLGGSTTWAIFPADTDYFGDRTQPYMINYRVRDLNAMLAQLRAAGVRVADEVNVSDLGSFGWAYDPEGNRFELWQPPGD